MISFEFPWAWCVRQQIVYVDFLLFPMIHTLVYVYLKINCARGIEYKTSDSSNTKFIKNNQHKI